MTFGHDEACPFAGQTKPHSEFQITITRITTRLRKMQHSYVHRPEDSVNDAETIGFNMTEGNQKSSSTAAETMSEPKDIRGWIGIR